MALLCLLTLTACGDSNIGPDVPALQTVDDRRGIVDGVGVGSSKSQVAVKLGEYQRPAEAYPAAPADVDESQDTGPWSVITGPHHLGPGGKRGEQVTLRYTGAAFFVYRDRVFGFVVTARNSRTTNNVRVGDDLAASKKSYPSLRCEGASSSDTSATQAPNCSGFVNDDRWIYFGGDPIRSITVMEHDSSHYDY
jgi:hypothetical protein